MRDPFHRFMDKVDVNVFGCWNWTGVTGGSTSRYGYFRVGTKATDPKIPAHRYIYEYIHGEIPEDLEIDHLCRNKMCVNPSHLEAVTPKENSNRVDWSRFNMYRNKNRDNLGRFVSKTGGQ